jgi:hypothetical protein
MTFVEALQAVYRDPSKMAVPVIPDKGPIGLGVIFNPREHPCWSWVGGRPVQIPAPRLLFGEWEVREIT